MAQHDFPHLGLVPCRAARQQVMRMLQREALFLAQLERALLRQPAHILQAPAPTWAFIAGAAQQSGCWPEKLLLLNGLDLSGK